MRHVASLSPIALLSSWQLAVSVDQGRHRYRLRGEQTAYGRGLGLEAARAALAMEIVERASAYAVVENDRLVGLKNEAPLELASFQALCQRGARALNPGNLALEVPYRDQALVWMTGVEATDAGEKKARMPAQCVFLFANFDEPALFSALGSTGLAAGSTMAEARLGALMEIIERHCDAVTTPLIRGAVSPSVPTTGFCPGCWPITGRGGLIFSFRTSAPGSACPATGPLSSRRTVPWSGAPVLTSAAPVLPWPP